MSNNTCTFCEKEITDNNHNAYQARSKKMYCSEECYIEELENMLIKTVNKNLELSNNLFYFEERTRELARQLHFVKNGMEEVCSNEYVKNDELNTK